MTRLTGVNMMDTIWFALNKAVAQDAAGKAYLEEHPDVAFEMTVILRTPSGQANGTYPAKLAQNVSPYGYYVTALPDASLFTDTEPVTFVNGKAKVKLKHNEVLMVYGIPLESVVAVRETVDQDFSPYLLLTYNGYSYSGSYSSTESRT